MLNAKCISFFFIFGLFSFYVYGYDCRCIDCGNLVLKIKDNKYYCGTCNRNRSEIDVMDATLLPFSCSNDYSQESSPELQQLQPRVPHSIYWAAQNAIAMGAKSLEVRANLYRYSESYRLEQERKQVIPDEQISSFAKELKCLGDSINQSLSLFRKNQNELANILHNQLAKFSRSANAQHSGTFPDQVLLQLSSFNLRNLHHVSQLSTEDMPFLLVRTQAVDQIPFSSETMNMLSVENESRVEEILKNGGIIHVFIMKNSEEIEAIGFLMKYGHTHVCFNMGEKASIFDVENTYFAVLNMYIALLDHKQQDITIELYQQNSASNDQPCTSKSAEQ